MKIPSIELLILKCHILNGSEIVAHAFPLGKPHFLDVSSSYERQSVPKTGKQKGKAI